MARTNSGKHARHGRPTDARGGYNIPDGQAGYQLPYAGRGRGAYDRASRADYSEYGRYAPVSYQGAGGYGAAGAGSYPAQPYDGLLDERRRQRKRRRVVITIVCVILALLAAVGVAAALYLNGLTAAMNLGDRSDSIEGALTDVTGNEPYYILLVGSDWREGLEGSDYEWAGYSADSVGSTDVMILARIDGANKAATLLSVPRDTPVRLDSGEYVKLNKVYEREGYDGLIRRVSEFAGVPVSHYVEIHMSGFMQVVDTLGGITVDVPTTISYHEALTSEEITLEPGEQVLNGAQLEVFVRERTVYGTDQDKTRQSVVRTVTGAIMDKILGVSIFELPGVVMQCAECVQTDMTSPEILQLATMFYGERTMYQGTAPYAGDLNPYVGDLWLCYKDPEGWARVMEVVKSGGDPSTVSYEGDDVVVAGSPEDVA